MGPGARIAEAGMGSGALSHGLVRTLAPSGQLFSFDIDDARLKKGEAEMEEHRLSHLVSCAIRDVCKDGFGESARDLDGVFLDLPMPWLAVPAAKDAVRKEGGRFVSFSPCIEQVQKTCDALREAGFIQVSTVELVPRSHRAAIQQWDDLEDELAWPGPKEGLLGQLREEPEPKKPKTEDVKNEPFADHMEIPPAPIEKSGDWVQWVFPHQQPTHTGYLTSATLLSR